MKASEFPSLQYGMFIHFGLFSKLARGEWVMNRERISPAEMHEFAKTFSPDKFDAEALCDLAVAGGMRYIVFTTMHHEGFRMYDTALTNYNAKKVCGRDFVAEIVAAARKRGLKIGLYHSLNNWNDQPDAVAALEDPKAYELFIQHTFARLHELVEKYRPIDILWYDGWWPFNQLQWQSERMNAEMRSLQSDLLFNGRNCLPGDFATPENHLTAPNPWRPWEACMTLNDHWGFHSADTNWKSPLEVVKMLLKTGSGRGNLLLNIGPRGDGSIPERSAEIVRQVGTWLRENGGREAITDCEPMPLSPVFPQKGDRGDWDSQGIFSCSGNNLYLTMSYCPGQKYTFCGLNGKVRNVSCACCGNLVFRQDADKVTVELPALLAEKFCPVLKFECDCPPSVYRTGGMRVPEVKHPRYDPAPPDIQY